jgi:A/G-specific adenine glycosylase
MRRSFTVSGEVSNKAWMRRRMKSHSFNTSNSMVQTQNRDLRNFQHSIWQFYQEHRRTFAWRLTQNPYHILISEVMLQQTQTYRVEPKYERFVHELPNFESLASAQLHTVLTLWQGLGYNRRGKYLHELAQHVVTKHQGILPQTPEELLTLPGIGKATAASICAFAFNKPTIFIETNIRTVFIYSFFGGKERVDDKELLPLVEATVDQNNPREWYYALMDYGVYLKKNTPNPSRHSKHHVTQSRFKGSDRQIRGAIIRLLTKETAMPIESLYASFNEPKERVEAIIQKLLAEGFIAINAVDIAIR